VRRTCSLAILSVITLALAACGSEDVPRFINSSHISKVVLASTTSGRTSTATPAKDNVNELLNMLHLSDVTAGSKTHSAAPRTPGYTVVLYDRGKALLTVLIPKGQRISAIYLYDTTNSKRTGSYSLKHAIGSADLRGFIAKYPDSPT
jgi:hypothetical protein